MCASKTRCRRCAKTKTMSWLRSVHYGCSRTRSRSRFMPVRRSARFGLHGAACSVGWWVQACACLCSSRDKLHARRVSAHVDGVYGTGLERARLIMVLTPNLRRTFARFADTGAGAKANGSTRSAIVMAQSKCTTPRSAAYADVSSIACARSRLLSPGGGE